MPTSIEWTEETWNPVTGCSKVSPGCDNCYAETLSLRFGWSKKSWTPENAAENVVLHPERLGKPKSWREPRVVFVNSMSDLFHELIPIEFLGRVLNVMGTETRHTFQVLTKRPKVAEERLTAYYETLGLEPFPNVWIGTSIESWRFNYRADVLRRVPAAVRFISAEPLLDSLVPIGRPERRLDLTDIDWLIVGGESGLGFRPMDPMWVRELQERARLFRTAFFFKQWGGRTPKAGGRELDGRTWDEMPVVVTANVPMVEAR